MFNWKTWVLVSICLVGCQTQSIDIKQTAGIPPVKPGYVEAIDINQKVIFVEGEPYVAMSFSDYSKMYLYINNLVRYMNDSERVICYYEGCLDATTTDISSKK